MPSVTAGLRCPSLPSASATNTPAITPKPQPAVMTIQPDFSPFDWRSKTLATTPFPSNIMIIVPKNSPRNTECMLSPFHRCLFLICRALVNPIQGPADGLLPRSEQRAAALFVHLRRPAFVDLP